MKEQKYIDMLNTIARVLMWSFAMGVIGMMLWLLVLLYGSDLAYQVHSEFFGISRAQFALVHYAGLLMTKVAISVLFLFPYVGIKMALRKKAGGPEA